MTTCLLRLFVVTPETLLLGALQPLAGASRARRRTSERATPEILPSFWRRRVFRALGGPEVRRGIKGGVIMGSRMWKLAALLEPERVVNERRVDKETEVRADTQPPRPPLSRRLHPLLRR